MINKSVIIGRLTRQPEKRTAASSTVCNFTLAVEDGFDDNKQTDFIPCVAWNGKANAIADYSKKGDLLAIEGKIKTRKYEKDGRTIQVVEVRVDEVQFLTSKKENQSYELDKEDEELFNRKSKDNYKINDDEGNGSIETVDLKDDDLPF